MECPGEADTIADTYIETLTPEHLEFLADEIFEKKQFAKSCNSIVSTADFKVRPRMGKWTFENSGKVCDGIRGAVM